MKKNIRTLFRSLNKEAVEPEETSISADIPGSNFIKHISHEMEGLFFGVSSITSELKIAVANKEETDYFFNLLEEAHHVFKSKLKNYLTFTNFNAGFKNMIFEAVDLRVLIARIADEHKFTAAKKKVDIRLFIAHEMPEQIISDGIRIGQICTNLLSNAIKYTRHGTSIQIRIEKENESNFKIIIADQGTGLTKERLNLIREMMRSTKGKEDNAQGLGLLVTRLLAEDILKGKLEVSGKISEGTVFTVTLPFH